MECKCLPLKIQFRSKHTAWCPILVAYQQKGPANSVEENGPFLPGTLQEFLYADVSVIK